MNKVYVVEVEGFKGENCPEHIYTKIELFWKSEDANEFARMEIENARKENEHIVVSVYPKKIA